MAELRRDPIVGRWVIVRKDESFDPEAFEKEDHDFKQESTCQFCPGREHFTPPEIEVVRSRDSQPNTPGWTVRVVANKFPALRIEGDLNKQGIGMYDVCNGVGAHEIVIETSDHRQVMADFTNEHMLEVIKKYQSRFLGLMQDPRFEYVLIFKNYGESAGASIEHEHSQIIALPMVPKFVQEKLEGAAYHLSYRGRCVYCDMINQEYQDKERIVSENEHFLAFCPYVPRFPFELCIIPKKHSADFCEMSDSEQYHLACILKEVLYRVKTALPNPSYNFYIHTMPIRYENKESFHWHIEIIPILTRLAGFEWGTGFYVVPTPPCVAAASLKKVKFNQ